MLIDLQSLWERNFRLNQARGSQGNSYLIIGAASLNAYILTIDSGSYQVTGTVAGTVPAYRLTANVGSYGLNGTNAGLVYTPITGHTLTVDAGNYALTGSIAAVLGGRDVLSTSGIYNLAGNTVAFRRDYVLRADSGGYNLVGTDTALIYFNGTPSTGPLLAVMGAGS